MSPSRKGPVGSAVKRFRARAFRRPGVRAAYDDLVDLAAFEGRASEPVVSYKTLLKDLKAPRSR
jgi:hypothetical protein